MCVKIEKNEKEIIVYSEYNANLPRRARQIGGKWNKSAWVFDVRNENKVKDLYIDIYGEFGTCGDLVTVKIPVPEELSEYRESIYFCGRQVARAFGRDSGAQTGAGVSLVGCKATSGGSVKNWRTKIIPTSENAYIEILDVPRVIAEREGVEILNTEINIDTLKAEREELLARIAKIDELLK